MIPATNALPQSTYLRGNKCFDHVVITTNILDCINEISYLDYPSEFHTDHKPILVSVNQQLVSKVVLPNPKTLARRSSINDRINSK
jgi:hypothetical protein